MKLVDHTIADFEENARANRPVIARIEAGLMAFNEAAHADPMAAPLTLSIQAPGPPARRQDKSDAGAVVAGLVGSSAYSWMRVDMLWVDERERGKGLGRKLLLKAEEVARERHCQGIHLDTHSFQAPEFYLALGYQVFGELDLYPGSERRIYLHKRLTPTPVADGER